MIRLLIIALLLLASCRQYRRCELYYVADGQLRSTHYYRVYVGDDVKEWGYQLENGYLFVNRNCHGTSYPYLLADSAVTNTWEMCEQNTIAQSDSDCNE